MTYHLTLKHLHTNMFSLSNVLHVYAFQMHFRLKGCLLAFLGTTGQGEFKYTLLTSPFWWSG